MAVSITMKDRSDRTFCTDLWITRMNSGMGLEEGEEDATWLYNVKLVEWFQISRYPTADWENTLVRNHRITYTNKNQYLLARDARDNLTSSPPSIPLLFSTPLFYNYSSLSHSDRSPQRIFNGIPSISGVATK